MLSRTISFLLIALIPLYILAGATWYPQYSALFSQHIISRLRAASSLLPAYTRTLSFSKGLSTEQTLRTTNNMPSLSLIARPNQERGHADHGWLKTFHTFSFASYHDNRHDQFGCLRVINEDRVAPKNGFGTHSHREFEIFSYVVSGELAHKDSIGNTEVLKRGDIQMTSAGTGISHSEYQHGDKETHFLQIWSLPSENRLQPKYYTRHFTDKEKENVFLRVVAPLNAPGVSDVRESSGPAPVHSPINLYATLISPSTTLTHAFESRKGYIHVIQKSGYNVGKGQGAQIKVSGVEGADELVLREGDGVYVQAEKGAEVRVENVGDVVGEVLLFDIE